jgi:hypothetical protein
MSFKGNQQISASLLAAKGNRKRVASVITQFAPSSGDPVSFFAQVENWKRQYFDDKSIADDAARAYIAAKEESDAADIIKNALQVDVNNLNTQLEAVTRLLKEKQDKLQYADHDAVVKREDLRVKEQASQRAVARFESISRTVSTASVSSMAQQTMLALPSPTRGIGTPAMTLPEDDLLNDDDLLNMEGGYTPSFSSSSIFGPSAMHSAMGSFRLDGNALDDEEEEEDLPEQTPMGKKDKPSEPLVSVVSDGSVEDTLYQDTQAMDMTLSRLNGGGVAAIVAAAATIETAAAAVAAQEEETTHGEISGQFTPIIDTDVESEEQGKEDEAHSDSDADEDEEDSEDDEDDEDSEDEDNETPKKSRRPRKPTPERLQSKILKTERADGLNLKTIQAMEENSSDPDMVFRLMLNDPEKPVEVIERCDPGKVRIARTTYTFTMTTRLLEYIHCRADSVTFPSIVTEPTEVTIAPVKNRMPDAFCHYCALPIALYAYKLGCFRHNPDNKQKYSICEHHYYHALCGAAMVIQEYVRPMDDVNGFERHYECPHDPDDTPKREKELKGESSEEPKEEPKKSSKKKKSKRRG